ncbi:MAG: hypothetical protein QXP70_03200 [Methanomassiliicoccales archaeon]
MSEDSEVTLRSTIFKKGGELFADGLVKLDVETEKAVYLIVRGEHEDYRVRLMNDGTFNCTCRLGTLKAGKGVLCSHVVASILFVVARHRINASKDPGQQQP